MRYFTYLGSAVPTSLNTRWENALYANWSLRPNSDIRKLGTHELWWCLGGLAGQYAMCKKYAFYSSKRIRPYSTRTLPHPYIPYSTSPEGCAGCRVRGASVGTFTKYIGQPNSITMPNIPLKWFRLATCRR